MPSEESPHQDGGSSLDNLFDRDYLRFYAAELNDDTNDDEAQIIADILHLEDGIRILDLPCGHGRIARRLQAMGARVTGIDRCELFIQHAREDAAQHNASVNYQVGDMHDLTCEGQFDVVINWFTSFGYGDDASLRKILSHMHRALVPGGRLLLETLNLYERNLQPTESSHTKELVDDEGRHFLIDRSYYDPHDGRIHARRSIANDGQPTRTINYELRLFTLIELTSWMHEAGFSSVQAFGADGEVFRVDSTRMILVAQRN